MGEQGIDIIHNGHFHFTALLQREGCIQLRLYRCEKGYLAVATDLDRGPSVTNAAEAIATQVRLHFGLKDDELLFWIEHYPARRGSPGELDKVIMRWDTQLQAYVNPDWRRTTQAEIERFLGCAIDLYQ